MKALSIVDDVVAIASSLVLSCISEKNGLYIAVNAQTLGIIDVYVRFFESQQNLSEREGAKIRFLPKWQAGIGEGEPSSDEFNLDFYLNKNLIRV